MSLGRQLTGFRGFALSTPGRLARWLTVGCLTAGCGSDLVLPGGAPVLAIRVVDGDGQRGSVGETLPVPVVVEVTDAGGAPVEGATVEFALTVAGEGGEVTPSTARTDADGRAEAVVVLGDMVGVQTGEARVAGDGGALPTATFSAMAVAGQAPPPPANEPPTAEFEFSCLVLSCSFSDRSTDDDGRVVAWRWEFDDGAISTERNPSHTFGVAGRYDVRLRVTDDDGATDTRTRAVEVQAPASNKPPSAEFEVHCSGLTCSFIDKSKDDDGFIVSWHWIFGDGATSTERNPVHTYAARGDYDVILTVTDNFGAAKSKTHRAEAK